MASHKNKGVGTMNRIKRAKNHVTKVTKNLLTLLAGLTLALAVLILPASGLSEAGAVDSGDKNPEKVSANSTSSLPASYSGMTAASAGVALKQGYFVVANDEDNILRVYSTKEAGIKYEFKLSKYFPSSIADGSGKKKTDIEGVTKLGKYIFWIGSHSTSSEAEKRDARYRLFAHKMKYTSAAGFVFTPVGQPYTELLNKLLQDRQFKDYKFAEALNKEPKAEGGLSIEGLSASPDKKSLLIGFRNPVTNNMALIIPLLNPMEVIKRCGAQASFGAPIELDLGGFGIRDLVWWKGGKRFLILAGPYHKNPEKERFRLYQWTGERGDKPQEVNTGNQLEGLTAEAIVIHPSSKADTMTLQILSDDENDEKLSRDNRFRSVWIEIAKEKKE
jgi:hypothetical protein